MTCEWVKMPGGGMAMVCGPRQRAPRRKCCVPGCRSRSGFQCDFPTGRGRTCNRYVCDAHRSAQGEGIDFCPEHARQPALF